VDCEADAPGDSHNTWKKPAMCDRQMYWTEIVGRKLTRLTRYRKGRAVAVG
jgi:hypothetical protein